MIIFITLAKLTAMLPQFMPRFACLVFEDSYFEAHFLFLFTSMPLEGKPTTQAKKVQHYLML